MCSGLLEETVQFTGKTKNELAALDLYEDDALEVLGKLAVSDLWDRFWMRMFIS